MIQTLCCGRDILYTCALKVQKNNVEYLELSRLSTACAFETTKQNRWRLVLLAELLQSKDAIEH